MSDGSLDLYALFGLPCNAPDNDIDRAFRRLSLSIHLDKLPEAEKAEGEAEFKQLSPARERTPRSARSIMPGAGNTK